MERQRRIREKAAIPTQNFVEQYYKLYESWKMMIQPVHKNFCLWEIVKMLEIPECSSLCRSIFLEILLNALE